MNFHTLLYWIPQTFHSLKVDFLLVNGFETLCNIHWPFERSRLPESESVGAPWGILKDHIHLCHHRSHQSESVMLMTDDTVCPNPNFSVKVQILSLAIAFSCHS